jgi:hypothetical protein
MKLKPQFDRARSVVPYVIVNNQELQIHAGQSIRVAFRRLRKGLSLMEKFLRFFAEV